MVMAALLSLIAARPAQAGGIDVYTFFDSQGIARAELAFSSPPAQPNAAWQTTDWTSVVSLTLFDPIFGTQVYPSPFPAPTVHGDVFRVSSNTGSYLDGLGWVIQYAPVTSNGSTSLIGFQTANQGLTYEIQVSPVGKSFQTFGGDSTSWALTSPIPEPSGWIMAAMGAVIIIIAGVPKSAPE
jgi:hypothetical protein